MTLRKFFIGFAIICIVLVTVFVTLPGLYWSYVQKKDNYADDYQNLPVAIEAALRPEKNDKGQIIVNLDVTITNNSSKTINAIKVYIPYTIYSQETYGENILINSTPLSVGYMWEGLKFIGGHSTTTVTIQLHNPLIEHNFEYAAVGRIECELYITWIRYAWHLDQWGNGRLNVADIAEAPHISAETILPPLNA